MAVGNAAGAQSWERSLGIAFPISDAYRPVPLLRARVTVVVLHAFIKKTQKTPLEDKALALKRKNEHRKAEKD